MSVIRWQFYSLKNEPFNAIRFSGIDISVADFKDLIMKEKGMKAETSKLVVIDASNNEEYTDDTDMIPRNKQVYIRKVPIKQVSGPLESRGTAPPDEAPLTAKDLIDNKTVDLATANATEEDKLRAAMDQASQYYHPSQYTHTRGIRNRFQKPPPNYVCHSCGGKDHFRQQCPKGKGEVQATAKRATGFPRSHLVGVSRPAPGVLRDNKGQLVIPRADVNAILPSAQSKVGGDEGDVVEIPPELVCGLCEGLIKDAVIITCCSENYCDECIRNHLLEHNFLCHNCNSKMSPDKLVINKNLRMIAQKFQSRLQPGAKLLARKRAEGDQKEEAEQGVVTPPTQDGAVPATVAETSARSSPVPSDASTPCDSPQRVVAGRDDQVTPQGSPLAAPPISAPIVMAPQQQPHPLAQATAPLTTAVPAMLAQTFMPRPVSYNPFQLTASGPTPRQGLGGLLTSRVPNPILAVSQPKIATATPPDTSKVLPPISKERFLELQARARKEEIDQLKREMRSKRKRRGRSESVSSRGSSLSRSPSPARSRDSSQRRSPVLSRSRSPREPRRHHTSSAKHKKRKTEKESHNLAVSKNSSSKHHKRKKRHLRSRSDSDASSSKRAKSSTAAASPIPELGMEPEVEPVSGSGSNATPSRPVSPMVSPTQGEFPSQGHSVVNSPSHSSIQGESLLDESDNDLGAMDTNIPEEGVDELDREQVEDKPVDHECESAASAESLGTAVTAQQQEGMREEDGEVEGETEKGAVEQEKKEEEEEEPEVQCQVEEKTEPDHLVDIVVTEEEQDEYAQEVVDSKGITRAASGKVVEEERAEAVNGLEEGEIVEEDEKEKDMREVLSEIRKSNKASAVQTEIVKDQKRKHKQKHSKKVVVRETSSSDTPTGSDDDDSSDSSPDQASDSDESPSSPSEDERQRRHRHKAKRRRLEAAPEKTHSSRKVKHSSGQSSSKKRSRRYDREWEDDVRESSRHRKEKRSRHERERHKDSRHEKKRKKSKARQSSEERHRHKHRTSKHVRKAKHRS